MSIIPTPVSSQTAVVPAATDWVAISKTIAIELAFLASTTAIVTGHGSDVIIQLAASTGAALGVLRLADIVANVVNVKSFLNKPASGVLPQPTGTPLIQASSVNTNSNGGDTNARTATP